MQTILVGTEGHADDEQALAMLCATLNPSCVRLRIIHVILVPSNVPLGISMLVAEKEAGRILEQAQRIADRFHIETQTAILQGRTVGECLVEGGQRNGQRHLYPVSTPSGSMGAPPCQRDGKHALEHGLMPGDHAAPASPEAWHLTPRTS